jgi:predicted Zn-dependent protease
VIQRSGPIRLLAPTTIGVLLLGALLSGGLVRAEPAEDPDELRRTQEKMAELYEAKDDLKSALRSWRELLAADPERVRYLDQVSRLAIELGLHRDAVGPARKLVAKEPRNLRYLSRLVRALTGSDLYREALPLLETLQGQAPADEETRRELASAYEAAKRPRDALVQVDWLLARHPREVELRLLRVALLGDLDREREQVVELERIAALVPSGPRAAEVQRQLAQVFLDREDYTGAERHLEAALRAVPGDSRAKALLQKIRAERAAAKVRRARERRDAEQYQDWLIDIQDRGEDF